jgi:hypothetical protein
MKFNVKKRVLCTLFFFILSGCSNTCQKWQFEEVVTSCPAYNSSKISLPPQNPYLGIELEIIYSQTGMRGYLNSFSLPFPPNPTVVIEYGSSVMEATAFSLEGGQRILLPNELLCVLVSTLWDGITVKVSAGGYSAIIITEDFRETYGKLGNCGRE